MMPLVTHASPDETESLVDLAQDSSEEEDEDLHLEHPGSGSDQTPINRRSSTRVSQAELIENLRPGQIVKTTEFWILWSTFFLNTQAIGYINSMYKAYGQVFITDDHFLAVVGAFAAIFNAFGRVFWGHMCDKFVSFTVFLSNIIHIKTHWAKKIPGMAASESKLRLEKFQKVRGLRKGNFFGLYRIFEPTEHYTCLIFSFL